jgi:hypothetical protein
MWIIEADINYSFRKKIKCNKYREKLKNEAELNRHEQLTHKKG